MTAADRALVENVRYRLSMADRERKRASALNSLALKLAERKGAVELNDVETVGRRRRRHSLALDTLTGAEVAELRDWLRSTAYARRRHADDLEAKAATIGGAR